MRGREPKGEEEASMLAIFEAKRKREMESVHAQEGLDGAIIRAAERDDGMVEKLLALGASPRAGEDVGRPALGIAARQGCASAAKALLRAGADPLARDRDGLTPMARATIKLHEGCMRLLAPVSNIEEEFPFSPSGDGADPRMIAPLGYALVFGADEQCLEFLLGIADIYAECRLQGRQWSMRQLAMEWSPCNNAEALWAREAARRHSLAEASEIATSAPEAAPRGRARI